MTEETEVQAPVQMHQVQSERWVRPELGGYVLFKDDGTFLRAFSTCFEFIIYREMTALKEGSLIPQETKYEDYYRERTGEAMYDTSKLPAFLDRQEPPAMPMRDEVPTQPPKWRNPGQRIVDLAARVHR